MIASKDKMQRKKRRVTTLCADILQVIYDALGPYDWHLIWRIRQVSRRFTYYPPRVRCALRVANEVHHYLRIEHNLLLHRTDGPAYTSPTEERWFAFGKLHRIGGPAISYGGIWWEWWQRGKKHRIEGPAYHEDSGYHEHWQDGICQSISSL